MEAAKASAVESVVAAVAAEMVERMDAQVGVAPAAEVNYSELLQW